MSPSEIAVQNGALLSADQGEIHFSAQAGLNHWSLRPSAPISANARATNINIADLERVAKLHYPVSGVLSANVALQGTEGNPSGHGSLQIVKASAWDETINSLAVDFQESGSKLQSTVELRMPAGDVAAKLDFSPRTGAYRASINSAGLKLDQIHGVEAHDWGISGRLTVSANGSGTLKDPQLSGHLAIAQLQIRGQSVSDAEAQLNVARQHANFTVHSVISKGDLEAKGDVELAGGYNTNATVDIRALPIGPLLASYVSASEPNLQGQTEIHAELMGPLKEPAQIQAHVEIPTFNLAYGPASISLVRPLKLDYRGGVATLEKTELK
ncbi:MAG: hypothetical protein ACRD3S_12690, partial [Terracidiphilus sp.]